MSVALAVRHVSAVRGCYRRDVLRRLAERVLAGEGVQGGAELSVLFCGDAEIADLYRDYLGEHHATDVLSFAQDATRPDGVRVLGDIVISLETVARFCDNDPARMRDEVRLLFCHGLLHLLGYEHDTAADRAEMRRKQAQYLGVDLEAAWRAGTADASRAARQRAHGKR